MTNLLTLGLVTPFIALSLVLDSSYVHSEPARIKTTREKELIRHLESYIESAIKKAKVTGLSVALVEGQEVVWRRGFGYADKQQKILARSDTQYRAASLTKTFTAMAALQLHEQGRMNINAALTSYLPELVLQSRFGSANTITPANIMSHHAGLPTDYLHGWHSTDSNEYKKLVARLKNEFVAFPANKFFNYSNLGYSLLGNAISKVSKEDYSNYLSQYIFKPLNFKRSYLSSHYKADSRASLEYQQGKRVDSLGIRDIPAGGLITTVDDMCQFIKMIHGKGISGKTQVVSGKSLESMWTQQHPTALLNFDTRVGMGWFLVDGVLEDDIRVVGHDGDLLSHNASMMIAPDLQIGVIVLANDQGSAAQSKMTSISVTVASEVMRTAYIMKTGIKPSISLNKSRKSSFARISSGDDLSGSYMMSSMGLVDIEKKGDSYLFNIDGFTMDLREQKNGLYRLSKKLLGIIEVDLEGLESLDFYNQTVEGHNLLIVQYNGETVMFGQKIDSIDTPSAWMKKLGTYKVSNATKQGTRIETFFLERKNGHLLVITTLQDGTKGSSILIPIDDENAVVAGLGREFGGNVKAGINGALMYSGILLERD